MNPIVLSIATGIVTGLSTAIVWALIVYFYSITKSKIILRSVQKGIKSSYGVGADREGIRIEIENPSPWPVTVREVWLLNAAESTVMNKLSYRGDVVPIYGEHILLKPHTAGNWWCPWADYAPAVNAVSEIGGVRITIDFASALGSEKLCYVYFPPETVNELRKVIESSMNAFVPKDKFRRVWD